MGVLRLIRVVLGVVVLACCLGAAGAGALLLLPQSQSAAPRTLSMRLAPGAARVLHPILALRRALDAGACFKDDAYKAASADNGVSQTTTPVTPFKKVETGWTLYAPLIAREVGTACGPETPAFAAALGRWQGAHALVADGRMSAATLSVMSTVWLLRRPFVRAMKTGCPASPDEQTLATANPTEAYGGKTVQARPAALDAYRRMVAAARADIGLAPPALTIASAYRGPAEEAARCADGSCGNPAKARCSAHRTGLAFDLYLDDKPGAAAFSTADANRLRLSQTPAYIWLVKNADRFGFIPYPFEPWHWEWTGQSV